MPSGPLHIAHIRPARRNEWRDAFERLLGPSAGGEAERRAAVDALLALDGARAARYHPPVVALHQQRIVAACACLEMPGRTATVLLPPLRDQPDLAELIVALLVALADQAARRGVRLLQAILEREDTALEASVLARAGFTFLAELLYMQGPTNAPIPPGRTGPPLSWTTYAPETHAVFAEIIQASYQGSLDCVGLGGLRDIEDIIAAHKATGQFDPRCWFVALLHGKPAGVLLLAGQPACAACEVVYMGVAPWARGRGVGSAMMRRALRVAHERGAACLTLAVDEANVPARRLYERFGLRETARRRAWIRALGERADATARLSTAFPHRRGECD